MVDAGAPAAGHVLILKEPGTALILRASELEERYQLAFWDALIVAAALEGGATKVLTEDLNPGQIIEGLTIENPFRSAA